jgi:hypothetical protein
VLPSRLTASCDPVRCVLVCSGEAQ